MACAEEKDWRKLAEQVAAETDPKKLIALAEKLSKALAAKDPKLPAPEGTETTP
jgi:hypothetical protein